VLRRIFGPKRDEVRGGWRKLHNEELFARSRRMRWGGHVSRMEKKRNVCRVLVGKALGRPRRRWEDNIKMDL
jgi:hypothetical protein